MRDIVTLCSFAKKSLSPERGWLGGGGRGREGEGGEGEGRQGEERSGLEAGEFAEFAEFEGWEQGRGQALPTQEDGMRGK